MGMKETVMFGIFAFFAVIVAFMLLRNKPLLSLLLGLITPILIVLSGYNWRLALIDSGKDPSWLGYHRYPFALIILVILFAAALACIAASVFLMIRKKKS